jgi:predicted lipoprotein with Yx(FWY)xxD motif
MTTADNPRRRTRTTVGLAGAAGILLLTAACGSTSAGGTSAGGGGGTSVAPSTSAVLTVATTPLGSILTTGAGKTIYMFAADKGGKSNCTDTCVKYWPIVPAPASLAAPAGVTATLGVLTRTDGTKQLTVGGMPVYTYVGDSAAGAATGQGKNLSGGLWWVLSPGGTIINTMAGASPSTSTSKSGGGYGY